MSKLSKKAEDRLKIARVLTRAIEIKGGEVTSRVDALLYGEGSSTSVGDFVQSLHDTLAAAAEGLEKADLAHSAELADDPPYREKLDEREAVLREMLKRTTAVLVGAFGDEAAKGLGLSEAWGAKTEEIADLTVAVANKLENENLGADDDVFLIDTSALAGKLRSAAGGLKEAMADVERERQEAQETYSAREQATERWKGAYEVSATLFSAMANLAGHERLAQQLAPTESRLAGHTEPLDEIAEVDED